MSATKALRARKADAQRTASPPSSKRAKTSHQTPSGLEDLVDDNAREGKKLVAKLTNGVSRSKSLHLDESHAVLAQDHSSYESGDAGQGPADKSRDVINISSAESESSELGEDEDEDEEDEKEAESVTPVPRDSQPSVNGRSSGSQPSSRPKVTTATEDADMPDAAQAEDGTSEPTFGELLLARHPEPVNLQKPLQDTDRHRLVSSAGNRGIPTGHTLSNVLSQALRNNDKDLLETCFAMTDQASIRATLQRQQSHEVATLLERIAERIHRRPGRAGNLMIWVQWSLVCHGGYLAKQPELVKKLKSVTQVIRDRASGLQPLLHLKGKLDLLSTQLEHRRSLQDESRRADVDGVDDPSGVLYIEGQDDDWSESDDEAKAQGQASQLRRKRPLKPREEDMDESEDDDESIEAPNGILHAADESSANEDDGSDALVDVEAEEGSSDEDEEESGDEMDNESLDEEIDGSDSGESDMETTVKRPNPNTLNRKR